MKVLKRGGKLTHLPADSLPKVRQKDLSLKSWKSKSTQVAFLDKELDKINQKLDYLKGEKEYFPEPEQPKEEVKAEPPEITTINILEPIETFEPQLQEIGQELEKLEKATVETGKLVKQHPKKYDPNFLEKQEIASSLKEVNRRQKQLGKIISKEKVKEVKPEKVKHENLVSELEGSILELREKWEETQRRLGTIREAPTEIKQQLAHVDKEISRIHKIKTDEVKVVRKIPKTVHDIDQEISRTAWMEEDKAKVISQVTPVFTNKSQMMVDKKTYSELERINKVLKKLDHQPPQKKALIPGILKKIKPRRQEEQSEDLIAINKELSRLNKMENEKVKILRAPTVRTVQGNSTLDKELSAVESKLFRLDKLKGYRKTKELKKLEKEISKPLKQRGGMIIRTPDAYDLNKDKVDKPRTKILSLIKDKVIRKKVEENQELQKIKEEIKNLELPFKKSLVVTYLPEHQPARKENLVKEVLSKNAAEEIIDKINKSIQPSEELNQVNQKISKLKKDLEEEMLIAQ